VEQRIEVAFRDERRGEAGEVCLRELRNGDARVDEEELLIPPLVVLQADAQNLHDIPKRWPGTSRENDSREVADGPLSDDPSPSWARPTARARGCPWGHDVPTTLETSDLNWSLVGREVMHFSATGT
jgi:hypothetical protein